MNTAVLKAGIITGIILIGSLAVYAEDTVVLDKEQELVTGVEPVAEKEEVGFWSRIFSRTSKKPKKELPKIPTDMGEEEGFWTQLKNAFAYKVQPVKEESTEAMERNAMMVQGRELYRKGEYTDALETFKDVIQRDPYNITARRYIKACQEKLMEITMDDFDIVKRERLQEVERSWLLKPDKERQLDRITEEARTVGRPIDQNVNQIIPTVRYTDAKLSIVIDNLVNISDPKVSIVTDAGALETLQENNQDKITLQLSNVPFIEIIKYICKAKGLTYRVDDNAVVISDKSSVKMRTKIFQLSRSLDMIEIANLDSDAPKAKAVALFKKLGVEPADSDGATVSYDSRNNRLIVRNTDANLKIIEEFIDRYSETPDQVQIEARFVTIENDEMSQLVFRHFLTKNYRWDHKSDGDRYYLEAPNKQKELTPGLRYIRSFMNEESFDPLSSAYATPDFTSTGNDYEDYLRTRALRPQMPDYQQENIAGIESTYNSIRQQKSLLVRQQEDARAAYNAYQNFLVNAQPIIAKGGPQSSMYSSQLGRMYTNYLNAVNSSLTTLTQIQGLQDDIGQWDVQNKVANDGLGKIFDLQGVLGPAEYRSVIYALDNAEGVQTIFAPKVTVLNGQRAEIKDITTLRYNKTIEEAEDQDVDVGDAFSVIYEYAVTPKEWDTREYGTRLIVTPSVQPDDRTIELDVQPEVSDLLNFRQFVSSRENVYELPQFFVQSIKTTVTIDDGDTLVMGGLMRDRIIRTKDKVPILGDLPWVGRFWRGKSEVAKKSNLMVFLNAKIIDPSGQTIKRSSAIR